MKNRVEGGPRYNYPWAAEFVDHLLQTGIHGPHPFTLPGLTVKHPIQGLSTHRSLDLWSVLDADAFKQMMQQVKYSMGKVAHGVQRPYNFTSLTLVFRQRMKRAEAWHNACWVRDQLKGPIARDLLTDPKHKTFLFAFGMEAMPIEPDKKQAVPKQGREPIINLDDLQGDVVEHAERKPPGLSLLDLRNNGVDIEPAIDILGLRRRKVKVQVEGEICVAGAEPTWVEKAPTPAQFDKILSRWIVPSTQDQPENYYYPHFHFTIIHALELDSTYYQDFLQRRLALRAPSQDGTAPPLPDIYLPSGKLEDRPRDIRSHAALPPLEPSENRDVPLWYCPEPLWTRDTTPIAHNTHDLHPMRGLVTGLNKGRLEISLAKVLQYCLKAFKCPVVKTYLKRFYNGELGAGEVLDLCQAYFLASPNYFGSDPMWRELANNLELVSKGAIHTSGFRAVEELSSYLPPPSLSETTIPRAPTVGGLFAQYLWRLQVFQVNAGIRFCKENGHFYAGPREPRFYTWHDLGYIDSFARKLASCEPSDVEFFSCCLRTMDRPHHDPGPWVDMYLHFRERLEAYSNDPKRLAKNIDALYTKFGSLRIHILFDMMEFENGRLCFLRDPLLDLDSLPLPDGVIDKRYYSKAILYRTTDDYVFTPVRFVTTFNAAATPRYQPLPFPDVDDYSWRDLLMMCPDWWAIMEYQRWSDRQIMSALVRLAHNCGCWPRGFKELALFLVGEPDCGKSSFYAWIMGLFEYDRHICPLATSTSDKPSFITQFISTRPEMRALVHDEFVKSKVPDEMAKNILGAERGCADGKNISASMTTFIFGCLLACNPSDRKCRSDGTPLPMAPAIRERILELTFPHKLPLDKKDQRARSRIESTQWPYCAIITARALALYPEFSSDSTAMFYGEDLQLNDEGSRRHPPDHFLGEWTLEMDLGEIIGVRRDTCRWPGRERVIPPAREDRIAALASSEPWTALSLPRDVGIYEIPPKEERNGMY